MDERFQTALDEITTIVQQCQLLSLTERDTFATRLEVMVSTLRWEMLFLVPATDTAATLDKAAVARKRQGSPTNAM